MTCSTQRQPSSLRHRGRFGYDLVPSEFSCFHQLGDRFSPNGGFRKWWYPATMGFPTKNDHFGVFWGYHHLRKHPNPSRYSPVRSFTEKTVSRFLDGPTNSLTRNPSWKEKTSIRKLWVVLKSTTSLSCQKIFFWSNNYINLQLSEITVVTRYTSPTTDAVFTPSSLHLSFRRTVP